MVIGNELHLNIGTDEESVDVPEFYSGGMSTGSSRKESFNDRKVQGPIRRAWHSDACGNAL